DEHIDGVGADQGFGDLERLLAVIGLGDEKIIDVYAELAGVDGIHGMFRVDEGGESTELLRLRDDLQSDGGLAGRLGAEDLNHASAREAAGTEGGVKGDGAGGDHGDGHHFFRAQAHDGAFAKLLFN